MSDSVQPADNAPEPSFEDALSELQRIAGELEAGSLGLEESLARFEQGIALLRKCNAILERAEQKIEILTGRDPAGNPTVAPFDATATATAPAQQKTSQEPPAEVPRRKPAAPPPTRSRPPSEPAVVVTERVVERSVESTREEPDDDGPRLF
jgi:exodeoxyribonuclease VII small subunit